MERGGGVLHSNLKIHASLPCCWPLISRLRAPLRCSRDHHRRPLRAAARGSPKLLLADHFRSYICSKEKGCRILHKSLHKPHTSHRVFSSSGPQEVDLTSEETGKNQFIIDCGSAQECVLGGIVALGKFDALHIGHRELAIQASKAGVPFLLSFVGMAEVLGWESRAPIVAKCDRKRVLSSWAPYCGNVAPLEFQVEFSSVRHLTPRQFVERLSKDLRVSGVVAGENYRFGYRASGDALELVRLCREHDLAAFIVKPVMDTTQRAQNGAYRGINSDDRGQVSSSRVRHALSLGEMQYVEELLGRKHRLVVKLDGRCCCTNGRISAPKSCMLNMPPKDGVFDRCTLLLDDTLVGPCRIVLDAETIDIELHDASSFALDVARGDRVIGVEFS